ncbi:MAG: phosphoribosylamine--glycine ligase [Bryobacterales bacterium]|nr:phosphoribosylamine--glycine ligase [Bryobacterales bacterium]
MRKVLVLGGGGREHALAWKLSQSSLFDKVFAAPGNPGIAQVATCVPVRKPSPQDYVEIARHVEADLTVVGPEAPLAAGVVDAFRAAGLRIVGPTQAAAQLEASKVFSKQFMVRAGVPTAHAVTVDNADAAEAVMDEIGFPIVLKADGLAAGKGVIISPDKDHAVAAVQTLPPGKIVVEEFLQGEEVSFIVLATEKGGWPLAASQDHKAARDGDQGPNTGGMGAYCDGRILSPEQEADVMARIINPTLQAMADAGTPFTGFLYAGLMMTASGPKVLEYNVRLGDPETQALLHRLDSDLGAVFLENEPFRWKPDPSVCVILAAYGYPGAIRAGDQIKGLDQCPATVFHSGTAGEGDYFETAGGRVLGVTSSGPDLATAIDNTYAAVKTIQFRGMHYRTDIGRKGLKRW